MRILHLAAYRGEMQVEAALKRLLDRDDPICPEAVEALMETPKVRAPAQITVARANLAQYDALLPGGCTPHATELPQTGTAEQTSTKEPHSEDPTR